MRVYEGKYLSVTSVIGLRHPFNRKSFEIWCSKVGKDPEVVLRTSQLLGTKVSDLIEYKTKGLDWLTGTPIDKAEKHLYNAVNSFFEDYKVLSCEEVVKNDKLNYAGRYDGVIEGKDGKYLADWKTFGAWKTEPYKRSSAKIRHVKWQLNMYAEAMGWKDKLCVVVFKNDGTYEVEEIKKDTEILEWVEDNQDLILKTIKENGK